MLHEIDGDKQARFVLAMDDGAFEAGATPGFHTYVIAGHKSRFGRKRFTGLNEPLDLGQIQRQLESVADLLSPRNTIRC